MINVLKYLLIGLVQGIAEVLPISSSGHLAITYWALQMEESIALSVFLHVASLIAVLAFLWKDLVRLIKGFFLYIFKKESRSETKTDFMVCIYLVVSTIVLVAFTLFSKKVLGYESSPIWVVGLCLVANAIMLFFLGTFKGSRTEKEMTFLDAIVVGLFQCAGSFAGISRSGSCLCGCNIRKLDKETSARYAFLLFIPACLGGLVLDIKDIGSMLTGEVPVYLYAIAFVVAGVATYFAFAFLKKIIAKGKLTGFSIYCALVGVLVTVLGFVIK